MISKESYYQLFKEHLGFLETDYGLKIEKVYDYDCSLRAKNNSIDIYVSYDKHEIDATLEPIGNGAEQIKQQGYRPEDIAIGRLSQALGAKLESSWDPITTNEQLEAEFIQIARLLKQYCEPMLRGDFSDWYKYENFINGR